MDMYNLLEYSKNYRKTTGLLFNYYRDEPNSGSGGANNDINYSIKDAKSYSLGDPMFKITVWLHG